MTELSLQEAFYDTRRSFDALLTPAADIEAVPPAEVEDSLQKLASPWVRDSLQRDPYWPKWDSPWWHITLLYEMGLLESIPQPALLDMGRTIDAHYLHIFPLTASDVPAGMDAMRQGLCHCGLGTMYGILNACGLDADALWPWARSWFQRYQMPDGGLNCDEEAYLRDVPRSSVVSTLPPLEAMLRHPGPLSADEEAFLERGARYLLRRRLCCSLSKGGALIDRQWLVPTFPRFYEYDVLRGLAFVTQWAERFRHVLSVEDIRGAVAAVSLQVADDGLLKVGRSIAAEIRTKLPESWEGTQPALFFPLLQKVSVVGHPSPYLTRSWNEVVAGLLRLRSEGLLQ